MTPIGTRDQVAVYRRRGWYCVPLRPRSKVPVRNDWPNLRVEPDQVKEHFSFKDNVGLILGEPSGWLVDVDVDCQEAIELADHYLPPTPAVTGRPSVPNSHRWYIAKGATTHRHTDSHDGSMIVELRSTGTQSVVTGSASSQAAPRRFSSPNTTRAANRHGRRKNCATRSSKPRPNRTTVRSAGCATRTHASRC